MGSPVFQVRSTLPVSSLTYHLQSNHVASPCSFVDESPMRPLLQQPTRPLGCNGRCCLIIQKDSPCSQVIAFTCCVITTFLMVAATANTEWIKSEGWREGLFEQCVSHGAPHPIPFGGPPIPGCHRAHDAGKKQLERSTALLTLLLYISNYS